MASTSNNTGKLDYAAARDAGFTDEQIAESIKTRRASGQPAFVDPAEVQAYRNSFSKGPAPYQGQPNPAVETAKGAGSAFAAEPATWLLRQVGARVDAGEAGAIKALTGQGAFWPDLGAAVRGYVTGNPPAGLPREQASFQALRNTGLSPNDATGLAIAGSIPAGIPLDIVGGSLAEPVLGAASFLGKALIRTNPATRSLARMVSRTGEMAPKDAAATERMFEAARGEQRDLEFQGNALAQRFDKLGQDSGIRSEPPGPLSTAGETPQGPSGPLSGNGFPISSEAGYSTSPQEYQSLPPIMRHLEDMRAGARRAISGRFGPGPFGSPYEPQSSDAPISLARSGDRAAAVRDAAENYSRFGNQALEGLSQDEQKLALDTRQWLDAHPQERPQFGLQQNDLGAHIRGFAQDVQRSQAGQEQAQATANAANQMAVPDPFGGRAYGVLSPVTEGTPPQSVAQKLVPGGLGQEYADGVNYLNSPEAFDWRNRAKTAAVQARISEIEGLMSPQRMTRLRTTPGSTYAPEVPPSNVEPISGAATGQPTYGLSPAQSKDYADLLRQRRSAATQARTVLKEKMQLPASTPPSQVRDIAGHIEQILPGYFPRGMNEEAAAAGGGTYRPNRAPGGLNVTAGAGRKLSPEMTTAEANAVLPPTSGGNFLDSQVVGPFQGASPQGHFFETPGASLRMYSGKEGVKRRNAIVLQSLAKDGQPVASAPKGWVPMDRIASQAGLDDATKATLSGISIKPEFARYATDFVKGSLPQNEAAALAFSRKMGSTIKPLLTIANPGFLEKFMGWHALKLAIDGEANPGALALAVKAMRGGDLAAPVAFKGAPQIKTLGDLRDAMIRAGTFGGRHGAGQEIFPGIKGIAAANTKVYDATKSTYFISRLSKGDDILTAGIKAKRALLDYSPENFTNLENFVRQHVAYFYAFPRQIVPAFVRTLIGRPGSMGAMQQVSANAGARIGVTPDQIQNEMGPAISEQGGIPVSRSATNPDSVNVLRTTVNPFSHVNQLFGTRGRPGLQGPIDAVSSMISNPVIKGIQYAFSPNYDSFLGKTLEPAKPAKAPSAARWIVQAMPSLAQKMRLSLVNGQPYAPETTVRWLYMTPQVLNAAADLANLKDVNSRNRARKYLGLIEDQVDMAMQRDISQGKANRLMGDSLKYEARLQSLGQ